MRGLSTLSDVNALEHHGLNRCLDVGLEGYRRYIGYGVLAFNLHVIGRELLARKRARRDAVAACRPRWYQECKSDKGVVSLLRTTFDRSFSAGCAQPALRSLPIASSLHG